MAFCPISTQPSAGSLWSEAITTDRFFDIGKYNFGIALRSVRAGQAGSGAADWHGAIQQHAGGGLMACLFLLQHNRKTNATGRGLDR